MRASVKTYLVIAAVGAVCFTASLVMAAEHDAVVTLLPLHAKKLEATEGDSGVTLLTFSANSKNKDATLTGLAFNVLESQNGEFTNLSDSTRLQLCQLEDLKTQTVLSQGATLENGQLVFTPLKLPVPKGQATPIRVTCTLTLSQSTSPENYELALAVPIDSQVVGYEDLTHAPLQESQLVIGHHDLGLNLLPTQTLTVHTDPAGLNLTRQSEPVMTHGSFGQRDLEVLAFQAEVTGRHDLSLDELALTIYADSDGLGPATPGGEPGADVNDYVENCSLYADATLIDGPEAPDASGRNIFFSTFHLNLAGQSTQSMSVKCNFVDSLGSGPVYFTLDIDNPEQDLLLSETNAQVMRPLQVSGAQLNHGADLTEAAVVRLE